MYYTTKAFASELGLTVPDVNDLNGSFMIINMDVLNNKTPHTTSMTGLVLPHTKTYLTIRFVRTLRVYDFLTLLYVVQLLPEDFNTIFVSAFSTVIWGGGAAPGAAAG